MGKNGDAVLIEGGDWRDDGIVVEYREKCWCFEMVVVWWVHGPYYNK